MFKQRILALVMIMVLTVTALTVNVSAQDETIVDIVAGNEDFSILVSLVEAAGLTEALATEGPFTLFAPTNEAFQALPDFVADYVIAHPELLTSILTYHIFEDAVMADDTSNMMATTVEGSELTLAVSDMGITVDQAHVIEADIVASNGVIHVIDAVLVPQIELPEVLSADVSGDIVTAGSSTVGPLSIAVVDQFVNEGYFGEITVDIIGSGAGFERFCELGETDISNASRPIRDSEIEACEAIGRTPIEIRVGTDALAVVINPNNEAFTALTLEQLALAFSTAETWADVDANFPEEPILRFIPGTDSGTFDYFVEAVFDEDQEPILSASNTQLSEDDNVLLEGVANNDWAIGFFGYAYYAENQDVLNILDIDDVTPNQENVDAALYPLARPLFIYTDAGIVAEKPQVGEFVSYYMSNTNDLIGEVGYFPANPFEFNLSRLIILALTDTGM